MLEQNNQKKDPLEGIQKVMTMAKEKVFREGEMLFVEETEDPYFYIILKGDVEVSKKISGEKAKVIAQVGEGEFLGEGVLFGHTMKPASAKAITEVTALPISSKNFERLIANEPTVAVDFLLYVIEAANLRLTKTNKKLLAVYEINQIINFYRDDMKQLSEKLVGKVIGVLDCKDGILLVRDPKKNAYKQVYSTSKDLNEKTFAKSDLGKAQMLNDKKGQMIVANLKDIGAIAVRRDVDTEPFDSDQLRFLMLIADLIAYTVKETYDKANKK